LDRIAREGTRFIHRCGQQSCTAGRAAFIASHHKLMHYREWSHPWRDPAV
jgi:hypothetical protein